LLFALVLPLASAKDIVVAYYNVENYLPMTRKVDGRMVENAPKPASEVNALISMLKPIRPDILGLAEMGDRKMLAEFQARLRAAGMDYGHVEWVAGDSGGSRHLAVLSRFPIVARNSRSSVPLELDGRRWKMGRGILDITVQAAPSYRLRLVGLHLKSKRSVPMYDEKKFRAREALIVRRHIDLVLRKNPNENLLLFGDLNDTKNEFPIKEILGPVHEATSLRDIYLRDRHGLTWTHFWSYADVYSRIDYLCASPGLWPEVKPRRSGIGSGREWQDASDHRPVFTTITARE